LSATKRKEEYVWAGVFELQKKKKKKKKRKRKQTKDNKETRIK
jgi:hypothetical protein